MIDVKDFGLARAQGIQLVSTEWFFSGKTEMHSDNDRFECQNCNHPELGKGYEIKKGNGIILWVCSKCMRAPVTRCNSSRIATAELHTTSLV